MFGRVHQHVVSALVYTILSDLDLLDGNVRAQNDVVRFVVEELRILPGHLRWVFSVLILMFNFLPCILLQSSFRRRGPSRRLVFVRRWAISRLPGCGDFVTVFCTLSVFGAFSLSEVQRHEG